MALFLGALGVFILAHSLPTIPPIRRRLTGLLGERGYLAAYSLVSLALLAGLLWSAAKAPLVILWVAPAWTTWLPAFAMIPATMLIGAGLSEPNPLSVSLASAQRLSDDGSWSAPGVVGLLRHPVLWGFALWSLAHIPPNGTFVHCVLFGGFALFSVLGMGLADRKRRGTLGPARWHALEAARHAAPASAWATGPSLLGAAAGLSVYAVLLWGGHAALIGVPAWPVL